MTWLKSTEDLMKGLHVFIQVKSGIPLALQSIDLRN
ncbi:hypothetical protein COLO4_36388 [Corchorus olitorius]|uniref:Uncharacterized protein n=1 Tax=Corchorus olitorius TaxID=93759 RepID=A0A1R3G953_9ROSI|nr:hypothetical protein COLO4_36388 [Corchorus olitorius]